jgi:hypothetical protein
MAAADSGFPAADRTGTTSTATPGWRSAPSMLPGSAGIADRARVHGSQGHRIRVTAWLLGVTSILLLLAGVGALFTASSAGAKSDRVAQTSLITASQVTKDDASPRPEAGVTILGGGEPSNGPEKVSVERVDGLWFGTTKSASGSCFLLAVRLSDGVQGRGTLGKNDPCTGAQARVRAEKTLVKSKP